MFHLPGLLGIRRKAIFGELLRARVEITLCTVSVFGDTFRPQFVGHGRMTLKHQPTFLFSGGGTGGHLLPGVATANELRRRFPESRVLFVGSERVIEQRVLQNHGFEQVAVPVQSIIKIRTNPLQFLRGNIRAWEQAQRLLREKSPNVVIGLGGVASLPVVLAASRLGIPVVLLEQNIIIGRANRWLCRSAHTVCCSFPETLRNLPPRTRAIVTGNPVRREIAEHHGQCRSDSSKTLLVLGGSQGAQGVNRRTVRAVSDLRRELADWTIVHQTGDRDVDEVRREYERLAVRYEVRPFFDDMEGLYSRATFVISRAGATTLAELACTGIPAILIPYPKSVRDHQLLNARYFERSGAAQIVCESQDVTADSSVITRHIRECFIDGSRLHNMSQSMRRCAQADATESVAEVITSCLPFDLRTTPRNGQVRRFDSAQAVEESLSRTSSENASPRSAKLRNQP